jgi:hypothetical protein
MNIQDGSNLDQKDNCLPKVKRKWKLLVNRAGERLTGATINRFNIRTDPKLSLRNMLKINHVRICITNKVNMICANLYAYVMQQQDIVKKMIRERKKQHFFLEEKFQCLFWIRKNNWTPPNVVELLI